jgi:hypothetical protein
MRALRVHGAGVLAEPIGSGKTWIALAASHALAQRTVVITPAVLRTQWLEAAARSQTAITVHTMERISRGRLPPDRAEMVIIDEAHRLRGPRTRRHHWLAPWLPSRRVLLVTGTPIVNSPRDLIRLLRLVLPDDTFRLDSVPSLEALATCRTPPHALRRVVIRSPVRHRPTTVTRSWLENPDGEEARGTAIARALETLHLGETPGVARLVRTVLLDAAASSDAAWRGTLHRYRRLLLQARDAGGLSRAALRRFAGQDLGQLVLWPVLALEPAEHILPLGDLVPLTDILAREPNDEVWMEPLASRLHDDTPTICFTRHLATAAALATRLGPGTAWATGAGSGIGPHRMPRPTVLAAFGPDRNRWAARRQAPTLLVLTDLGAEGLDLQGASRVVHVDLPWHQVGLEQRLGRCLRLGQRAPGVEEWRRRPPRAIAALLDKGHLVRHKGARARAWLTTLSRGLAERPVQAAVSDRAHGVNPLLLVGFAIGADSGVLSLGRAGTAWHAIPPEVLMDRLRLGTPCTVTEGIDPRIAQHEGWWDAMHQLTARVRQSRPELVARLGALARGAARRRDRVELRRLDALLAASSASHAVGLEHDLAALAHADDAAVRTAEWPIPQEPDTVRVTWAVRLDWNLPSPG